MDYYSAYNYPATVKAGSTGMLDSSTVYSVASDTATSLLVTLLQTKYLLSSINSSSQTIYRIDTSGGISLVSITLQDYYFGDLYKSLTLTF